MKTRKLVRRAGAVLIAITISFFVLVLLMELVGTNSDADPNVQSEFFQKYNATALGCSVSEAENIIGLRHGSVRYGEDDRPRTLRMDFLDDPAPMSEMNYYFRGDYGIIIHFDCDTKRVFGKELVWIEHRRNVKRAIKQTFVVKPLKFLRIW
jgi:hypothetical protein